MRQYSPAKGFDISDDEFTRIDVQTAFGEV